MGRRRQKSPQPQSRPANFDVLPACATKKKYESEEEAWRMQALRPPNMRNCVPYKCRHCDGWHMTSRKDP